MKSIIEGLLFLAGEEGITMEQFQKVFDINENDIKEVIAHLQNDLKTNDRGIEIVEIADTYQMTTKPALAPYIEKYVKAPKPSSLSQAALETLAIVAYKQPISRAQIEEIRGVKSERALNTLSTRGLIKEVGRVEGTGRAILYGVTDEFLSYFGLKSLEELPPLPEHPEDNLEDEDSDLFFDQFKQTLLDI